MTFLKDERGQAATELLGMLWLMILVALIVWQLMLAAWATDQAANAARTVSRVQARHGDTAKAARYARVQGPAPWPEGQGGGRDGAGQRAHPDRRAGLRRRPAARDAHGDPSELMGLRDRIVIERVDSSVDGVGYYRRRLLEEVDLNEIAILSEEQRRARLERVVGRMVSREGPVLSTVERNLLIRRVVDEAVGLGVLEPLLADDSVTEIMVNSADEIYVERGGRIERADISFSDEAQLFQTIDRIVSTVNRRVDESSPMVDARLPSGERVNVIIPPLALKGPTMTIRRFPRLFTIEELIGIGSMDRATAELLRALVRARLNIVISGGTGAGKTTLLNALSSAVPDGERIITVEDNAELRLQQPHVVTLEARPPNVEGKGEVSIRDLVRNSLRMRPDRIIVGEVRGAETVDMLQALNTGHEGSLVTLHANTTDDAIHRLATLASMSELQIPFEALRDQINSAIDVIVQVDRYADGGRRLSDVAVVASSRRETFRLASVMEFVSEPIGPDRRVVGHYEHRPLPDGVLRRLMLAGQPVPEAFA